MHYYIMLSLCIYILIKSKYIMSFSHSVQYSDTFGRIFRISLWNFNIVGVNIFCENATHA